MTNPSLKLIPPTRGPERETHSKADTIEVTSEVIASWKSPPFQRPIVVNTKVLMLIESLKQEAAASKDNSAVLPGFLTIGVLGGVKYLVDGQHRVYARVQSGAEHCYSDVRFLFFDSMEDMAHEFRNLNQHLVNTGPNDMLRAMACEKPELAALKEGVGRLAGYYAARKTGDQAGKQNLISMSGLIRCWFGSSHPTPTSGGSAIELAECLRTEDVEHCATFMRLAEKSWGRDPEYLRLWGSLNLTICMWLYRNLVIGSYNTNTPKVSGEMFRKCLIALAADQNYVDWLRGRDNRVGDRSPCYRRIRDAFVASLQEQLGKRIRFPSPEWSLGT